MPDPATGTETRRGVVIVAVAFIATALAIGASQYAFGLFIPPLEVTFGWSRTEISASLSFAAVSGLTAPFIGRAMDRLGTRPILAASLAVMAVSFALRPLMTELWHWYALSFLQFVAFAGASTLPMAKLVALWFPHSRGRVMGFAMMGNNFGGLAVPPAVAALLTVTSWQHVYVAIGLFAFVIAGAALVVVRESPSEPTPVGADGKRAPARLALSGHTVGEALRSRTFYAVFIAVTLGSFTYGTVLPHAFAHFANEGMSNAAASFALGALAIGGLGGKFVFGMLADRLGARRATVIDLVGQAIFVSALGAATNTTLLTALAPLFGFFMGGFGVLNSLLVQELFGLRNFGGIMGLMNLSVVVSFGFGPVLAGASYDYTGGYGPSFTMAAAMFAIGAAILARSRPAPGDFSAPAA